MDHNAQPRRRVTTGDEQLDASQRAVLAAIAYTSETGDDKLPQAFGDMVDALEAKFRHEESLMETIGLPSIHTHREQHMRVLSALRLAEASLGVEPWLARHALILLEDWLELHVQTQDAVLALALELASAPPGN
jgi:hemerythrin-like metal-binding protein